MSMTRRFSTGTRLRNIILLVADPRKSASFYHHAIGVSIQTQSDSMVQLETGGTSIILKVTVQPFRSS